MSKVGALLLGAAALTSLGGCPRPAAKYGGPPVPQQRAAEPTTPAASETDKPPPSDASADAGDLQAESGTPSPGR